MTDENKAAREIARHIKSAIVETTDESWWWERVDGAVYPMVRAMLFEMLDEGTWLELAVQGEKEVRLVLEHPSLADDYPTLEKSWSLDDLIERYVDRLEDVVGGERRDALERWAAEFEVCAKALRDA